MNLKTLRTQYLNKFFWVLMLAVFVYAVFFLYQNFYQTLTQAKVVYLLKSRVSPYALDMSKWESVITALDRKKEVLVEKENLPNNPFRGLGVKEEIEIEE